MKKMTKTEIKLAKARLALVNTPEFAFFGALAMRLKVESADWIETAAVDGVSLFYNPEFTDSLNADELKGLLAHEVMHCGLGHPWRRGSRDVDLWNDACDFAVDPLILAAGLPLPDGGHVNPEFAGLSAEQIYTLLKGEDEPGPGQEPEPGGDDGPEGFPGGAGDEEGEDQPGGSDGDQEGEGEGDGQGDEEGEGEGDGNGQGEGEGDGPATPDGRPLPSQGRGGVGAVIDAPADSPAEAHEQEAEWKLATAQAAQIQRTRSTLWGSLEEAIANELSPRGDWRALLREFMTRAAKDDYTWSRPNRRHIGNGLYLPSVYSERCPPIVVAVDTSGSIDSVLLEQFQGELNAILEDVRPELVHVVYCDARVTHTEEFEPDQLPITLTARGRGGTAFQPVFDWIEQEMIDPAGLVYLTDLYGDHPRDPGYPVLWADFDGSASQEFVPSFGERVMIERSYR